MSAPELALEVRDLVKVYDPTRKTQAVRALDGLTLEVQAGETMGFLGPNGAGKTTTIRTIATLVRPTSGTVKIYGVDVVQDPDKARMLLGYVPQEVALDRLLTVREHLELAARMHRVSSSEARTRADEVLKLVRLEDKANAGAKTLSGGMKKRLDLGMGLVHRPRLLVLDEPTVGLDLDARAAVWDFLVGLKAQGTAILISTHSMEEADRLSDRVAIVARGKVQKVGKPDAIKAELEGDVLEARLEGGPADDALLEALKKLEGVHAASRTRDGFEVTSRKATGMVAAVDALLREQKRAATSLGVRRPTLEDVFRRATGRSFGEEEK